MDDSAVAQFFKNELKDRNSEVERLTEELRVKEIRLMTESKKVSGLQRDLYDINREVDVAKSANFKQQVEIDRLRMKCGEDVKVRAYKHRYKSEKIHVDTPEKDKEGASNKENQPASANGDPQAERVGSEVPASATSVKDQEPAICASNPGKKHGSISQTASKGTDNLGVQESSVPLSETPFPLETPCMKPSDAQSQGDHTRAGVLVDCSEEARNLAPSMNSALPKTVKPRHSKIQTVDRNKVTAPAECKQQ